MESNAENDDKDKMNDDSDLVFKKVEENGYVFHAGMDEVCSIHFNSVHGTDIEESGRIVGRQSRPRIMQLPDKCNGCRMTNGRFLGKMMDGFLCNGYPQKFADGMHVH